MLIDIDHLRGWVGNEDTASEEITPSLVRRFNATLDRESDTSPGAVAPVMLHLCLAQPAVPTAQLGPDGHPTRGGFLPPVPLPRRMWAGGALKYEEDMRIGETMTRRSLVRDVTVKEGSSGLLCFVTVDHIIASGGRPVLEERQDIVYRGAATGKTPGAPAPAAAGEYRRVIAPSEPMLFRYSALTFNTHRIHYDAPYAREAESYPGLVVHGPMQATLLIHFAEAIKGERPRRFTFRSRSPLFNDADFTLNAAHDGAAIRLWTARDSGPVAMEAKAEW